MNESSEMETENNPVSSDVVPGAVTVDGQPVDSADDPLRGTVESTQVEADQPAAQTDISFNVAIIFVLSMIVGLVIYHILSRRWHT